MFFQGHVTHIFGIEHKTWSVRSVFWGFSMPLVGKTYVMWIELGLLSEVNILSCKFTQGMMCCLKGLCSELVCCMVMVLLPVLLQIMSFFACVEVLQGIIDNVYYPWLKSRSVCSLLVHHGISGWWKVKTFFILATKSTLEKDHAIFFM